MRTLLLIMTLLATPTMVAPTVPLPVLTTNLKQPKVKSDYEKFTDAMGSRESSNNYTVVNKYGYMGKYQFGKSTLRTLKIKVTKEAFLNSPDLQEYAMLQNLIYNKKKLQKYIDKYEGQIINEIYITESGILAAAHLGGPGSVRKFFRSGKIMEDGNGVKITSYLKQFGGYDLDI
tara:strand:- start:1333 stop:1857 length:525 start_codon:yes stop_codon:yes gene_type:complete